MGQGRKPLRFHMNRTLRVARLMVPRLLPTERIYRAMIDRDPGGFAALRRDLAILQQRVRNGRKYTNVRFYLRENIARALNLGLDQAKPLRILDLGCGAGYFLAAAKELGHEATGLDLFTSDIYSRCIAYFQVPRINHRIVALSPLPDAVAGPFDVVTAFSITFDMLPDGGRWREREWQYFLADVRERLAPGGMVFLRFNSDAARNPIPEETRRALRAIGGYTAEILDDRHIRLVRAEQ